jgi:hypothetical protein
MILLAHQLRVPAERPTGSGYTKVLEFAAPADGFHLIFLADESADLLAFRYAATVCAARVASACPSGHAKY